MSIPNRRMLSSVLLIAGLLFGCYGLYRAIYQAPAVVVLATKTAEPHNPTVGDHLTAINGIELSAETPGTVKEIRFNSGQLVKKGEVLIRLDTTFEEAQLKDRLAKLKLAELAYAGDTKFVESTSNAQANTRLAELQQIQASLEEIKTKIKRKTIRAPFAGRLGVCRVKLGQYIAPGTTLVTLQALNPLYVRFTLPEQLLPSIKDL